MPRAHWGVWGCSLHCTLPAFRSHLLVSGEAEAKQCGERRWMLSYRELFHFFLWFLVFLLRSVLRSKAFWRDWKAAFFFLWERRKRNPVSYFAQLSTVPAMLIEFAPVIKLKWMLIIFLDRLVASALWKVPPSSESFVFRALHQAASSKHSQPMTGSSCLPLFLLCQVQETLLLILWSRHCASEKLTKYEVTTMLVFLWYFLKPLSAGKWMCCTYLASGRQELRLSFCALHCFSSLSFHLLYGCAASNRVFKGYRTGVGILPACPCRMVLWSLSECLGTNILINSFLGWLW